MIRRNKIISLNYRRCVSLFYAFLRLMCFYYLFCNLCKYWIKCWYTELVVEIFLLCTIFLDCIKYWIVWEILTWHTLNFNPRSATADKCIKFHRFLWHFYVIIILKWYLWATIFRIYRTENRECYCGINFTPKKE